MNRHALALLAVSLLASLPSPAAETPAELDLKLKPYSEFRPHGLLSWHPLRREMLVRRRLDATQQVHLVTEPGVTPQPLADLPAEAHEAAFQPANGSYFIFLLGEGGDEARLHRYDLATRTVAPVSPAGERAIGARWSGKGDRVVYTTRTAVHLVDPLKPKSDRVVARRDGGDWTGLRLSEDGRRLVFVEHTARGQCHLWILDIATGKKRRVTRPSNEVVSYSQPHFSRDGRSLFATSDRDAEFKRLVQIDIASGRERLLTGHLAYDVDEIAVSFDAERIAFTTNQHGSHVLRFIDLRSLKEQPRPPLFDGVIGGLAWRRGSVEIGFHITSARSAGDVFSYDVRANRFTRWTNGNSPGVNTSDFAEPRTVKWLTFDGREMSGLHYHPPRRFEGRRPVIVSLPDRPELQAKPGFIGRDNYFVSELGIAMIYPSLRGARGFGKSFATPGDGALGEAAGKDIGALIEWIRAQPDLDAVKVLVVGRDRDFNSLVEMARRTLLQ